MIKKSIVASHLLSAIIAKNPSTIPIQFFGNKKHCTGKFTHTILRAIFIMTTKTQQVISHILEQIQWQFYRPKQRVPSVRELAKTLDVSPYTVVQAYDSLVAQGYLTAVRGSGYFVSEPTTATQRPLDTPALTANVLQTEWLLQHLFTDLPAERCSGSGLLSPDWLYPPSQLLKAHKKASQSLNFVYGYGNIQGFLPLREQLARQLYDIQIHSHPDQMLTTSGVSSGIEMIVKALCQAGDCVLVDDPTWFWIIGCLQQLGLRVIGIPRDHLGIDLALLEQQLSDHRPKLYITNSVLHNPTSFHFPPSQIFAILNLMEKYDCYVVEDDVYRYFEADNSVLRFATLDNFQRVLYLTGIAKVLGGNWRVGLICSPPHLLKPILRQKMLSNMTCPEITERTIFHIWQDSAYKKQLTQVQKNLATAHATLAQNLTRIGLVYPKATQHGLFAWVDVGVDSQQLALNAYQAGWLVAPSHLFSPTARQKNHIRLNVTRTSDAFLAWLQRYLDSQTN